MKFKVLYFISNLMPVLILAQRQPHFVESLDECSNETQTTREEFFNIMRHEIPKTEAEGCLLACVQKKMGFMSADNTVNITKILNGINHMKNFNNNRYVQLKRIYEDCKTSETAGPNECIAAKNFAECVYPKERAILPARSERPRPHGRPQFHMHIDECKNKTNAEPNEIEHVIFRDIPKTKNEECMLACLQKKMGIMGEDNKINFEKAEQRIGRMNEHNPMMYNRTIQIYAECKTIEITEEDECTAAKKYAECMFPKEKMNHLPPVMRKNLQECQNTTSATEIEVYNSIFMREVPKTKGESCILACMQKKTGFMNTDNTMAIDKISNTFRNLRFHDEGRYNETMTILNECKNLETRETDECVAAKTFAECFIPKENMLRET